MMKWGGQGGGWRNISTSTHQPNPGMMAMANMMMGGGGNINTNANQPNLETIAMAKMMMGSPANQPSPEMFLAMADMMTPTNSGGSGGNPANNNFRTMPPPPFSRDDFKENQQLQGDGPADVRGASNDDPAPPE